VSGITTILLEILREAWVALAAAILAFGLLAILANTLRTVSAAVLGANLWIWETVSALVGVVVLLLFGFLAVPVLVKAAYMPLVPDCGPIAEMGTLSAVLIGGIGALRMIRAILTGVLSASVGGRAAMSDALIEVGETVLGMAAASLVVPIAAHFLGAC